MGNKITILEDILNDYLILHGTTEGEDRLVDDMLAIFKAALLSGAPLPTAEDVYVRLKTSRTSE